MDIQEIQEKFEDLLLANPDFDESLLEKDEEGCYSDSDIQHMYSIFEAGTEVGEQWQAAKAQAVLAQLDVNSILHDIDCYFDNGLSNTERAANNLLQSIYEKLSGEVKAQEPDQ